MVTETKAEEKVQSAVVSGDSSPEENKATVASVDEAAIQKALNFWNHPSLSNVSADEKMKYLRSKGVTDEQLHLAWERLVEQPPKAEDRTMGNYHQQQPQKHQHSFSNGPPPPPQPERYSAAAPDTYNRHQQYHPSYAHHQEELHDGTNNAAMLLTVGGMLGLGAAAAVRWLNGGDFSLFPPPTIDGAEIVSSTSPRQASLEADQQSEQVEDPHDFVSDDYIIPHDDDEGEEEECAPNPILLQVQQLTQVLEKHVGTQERLLQKLTADDHRDVTDRSMELLRTKSAAISGAGQQQQAATVSTWATWAELVQLRAQLTSIQCIMGANNNADDKSELENKLSEILSQLSTCIQSIEKDVENDANEAVENVSPASTRQSVSTDSTASTSSTPAIAVASQGADDYNDTKFEGATGKMTLRGAIHMLVEQNEPASLRDGAQLLYLYALNLSSHPNVPRYRKIYTGNESFKKVGQLKGGKDLLYAVGFLDKGNYLEWQGEENDNEMMKSLKEATASLSILKSPQQHLDDPHSLVDAALTVVSREPTTNTPQRTNASMEIPEFPDEHDNDLILQTPQTNIIVSPPTTKKHPFLPSSGFPEAPLSILDESSSESPSILDISTASLEIRPLPPDHDVHDELVGGTQLFGPLHVEDSNVALDVTDTQTDTPLSIKEQVAASINTGEELRTPLVKNSTGTEEDEQEDEQPNTVVAPVLE